MEDNQKKRRSEQIAKRRLFRRTLVLMVVFGVATFGALLGKLWNLPAMTSWSSRRWSSRPAP